MGQGLGLSLHFLGGAVGYHPVVSLAAVPNRITVLDEVSAEMYMQW